MKLYAARQPRQTLQLIGDALLVVWIAVWVKVGSEVHDATLLLAAPGERMSEAGDGLAGRLREAGDAIGGLPVVGEQARSPLDGAGDAAESLSAAGRAQVDAVHDLALWLGISIALIPILIVVAFYVPRRIRFAREATAGQRFIDADEDLDLFALRAIARQPMHRLAQVSDDPAGAWRDRDPEVVRRLASLELRDAGLAP
jgi:hypothetical protein